MFHMVKLTPPFTTTTFSSQPFLSLPCIADRPISAFVSSMGIGNSKLDAAEGEVAPPKILPLLVAKCDECKKRRNAETTLSKKNLLQEDDYSLQIRDKDSSPMEIQPPQDETVVVPAIAAPEKVSRVVPVANSQCQIVEENHDHPLEQVNKDMVVSEAVEETKREKEHEVGENGGEDDHYEDDDAGRIICPGSPSFRIYCTEDDKREEEECNSSPAKAIVVHRKSHSADSVGIVASKNLTGVEIGSETIPKRKRNKKKFGAIRTLLKVKSCYHPIRSCTGHDRDLIVAAKAAK